jgi:hypothetical protein
LACLVVVAKIGAISWHLWWLFRSGGDLAQYARSRLAEGGLEVLDFDQRYDASRPIERFVDQNFPRGLAKVVRTVFLAHAVVILGVLAVFAGAAAGSPVLLVGFVGLSTALCALAMLAGAVLRRLVLGDVDACTLDVQVPRQAPWRRWAVTQDPGANLPILFAVMTGVTVLAFGALYRSIDYADPDSFSSPDSALSGFRFIYFSAVTLSTIGYGDVHPVETLGQIAVTVQIVAGPVLLSWLLAVFLGSRGPALRRVAHESGDYWTYDGEER